MYNQDIIERFGKIATASISDACEQVCGRRCFMDHEIKGRINDKKIVGPAVTVQEGPANGENVGPVLAIEAIDESNPGDVMVISLANGDKDVALWGGIMTAGAYANKMAGTILDGGLRDVNEVRRDYDYPVFSRSLSPNTTLGKYKTLAKNVPVICGGITVCPGDLVVADIDGVVVVPKDAVEEVLKVSEEIEVKEAEQARLIVESGSLKEGMAKYNRI